MELLRRAWARIRGSPNTNNNGILKFSSFEEVWESDAFKNFKTVRDEAQKYIIGRDEAIETIMLALLCRSHALLISKPGEAKTMILSLVCKAMGGTFFYVSLTKVTPPEFVFGATSLKVWSNGEATIYKVSYETAGAAPEAHFIFVDEVYSGSAAIKQALRSFPVERVFQVSATETYPIPLLSMFGATNRLPDFEEEGAEAFHDRFLFRAVLETLEGEDFIKVIEIEDPRNLSVKTSLVDLKVLQSWVRKVVLPKEIKELVAEIKATAGKNGIWISTRRAQWAARDALRANAFYEGRSEVVRDDLLVLKDIFWNEPEREKNLIVGIIYQIVFPHYVDALKQLENARNAYEKATNRATKKEDRLESGKEILKIRQHTEGFLAEAFEGLEKKWVAKILEIILQIEKKINEVIKELSRPGSKDEGPSQPPFEGLG